MYLTVKQQVKHLSKDEYKSVKKLCHIAKNLTNQAIYNIRQYYFKNKKFLSYNENYKELKSSDNYKLLNSNMAQQILMEVDGSFKSFFSLLKLAKEGKYSYDACKLPYYLPKKGYTTLVIGFVRIDGNKLVLPYSNSYRKTHSKVEITIPPILVGKRIKEIRIIPKSNARFFEIQYTYEAEVIKRNLNTNNALAIDLGINNLVTAVTNSGHSFIIDGRKLKSINQWYNKYNAGLQSINGKINANAERNKLKSNSETKLESDKETKKIRIRKTNLQKKILSNRNNRVNDYMAKTAKKVIDYLVSNDIGILVVGYNEDFQRESNIGKQNNQNFVNIPYGVLRNKLKYLCGLNSITYIEQEESYTSKASFFDHDTIPVYDSNNEKTYSFSGKRICRGLYRTKNGMIFNADVNGALNILSKSNVVSLEALYTRGVVDTPERIRVA